MKKTNIFTVLLSIIAVCAALGAVAVAITLLFERKRKDEEELEHYLDCSIQ